MENLQKMKTGNISPSMDFSASTCIHNIGVNQCVLPIEAFAMPLHHFLGILHLQIGTNCKRDNINFSENSITEC
jgi:hypothetical protein